MAENQPPTAPAGVANAIDIPGQPFYQKTREHLHKLLNQRRALEANLAKLEEDIYNKETTYLEETPSGNIIIGFDAYTKGTAAPGQRRRLTAVGENRIFSKSSITWNVNAESPMDTAQSTPVAAMAPTPMSTSFLNRDGASNHPTPTSASSANRSVAGAGKKNKKSNGDDGSDTDAPNKKARTNFSAVRK